jgi:signal peptidase I
MQKVRIAILIFTIISTLCLCCCVCFVAFGLFTPFVQIEGNSMQPNFVTGEIWVLNRFDNIDRGDVVVLKKPGRVDLIKRVIALPGEKILIQDGNVYINDKRLDESYLDKSEMTLGGDHVKEGDSYLVPANNYFVMGDNRDNSLDSRFINIGSIKSEWIEGELLIKIWPIN